MNRVYNYTSGTVGSKVPPYDRTIVTCGKCGQRGADAGITDTRHRIVIHHTTIRLAGDTVTNQTDEYCAYLVAKEAQCT